jgi:hypothetical protein
MKINRCPKCGREPVSMKVYAGEFFCGWKFGCFDCELHTGNYASKSKAIAKWNEITKGGGK